MAANLSPSASGVSDMTPKVLQDNKLIKTIPDSLKGTFGEKYLMGMQPYKEQQEDIANQIGAFEGEQKKFAAEQELAKSKAKSEGLAKEAEAIRSDPTRAQIKEVDKELMSKEFIPTKDNMNDMAGLFSLINIIGFTIGHGAKGNAQAAMSAMNGMMEGHMKGRDDLYKKEKNEFEANMKALKTKSEILHARLKEDMELYAKDREAGMASAENHINEANADFMRDNLRKVGLSKVYELSTQNVSDVSEAFKLMEKERSEKEKLAIEHGYRLKEKAAAEGGSAKGLQSKLIMQNVIGAGSEVATSMDAIMKMKAGTTAGIMPYVSSKEGMMNFIASGAQRTFTKDDSKVIHTFYTGLKRNLATIEAAGRSQGLVGLTSSIGDIEPLVGDDALTVAAKFAETRKIVEATLQPLADSGLMDAQQAAGAVKVVNEIKKIIPYNINDIAEAVNKGKTSLGESTAKAANLNKSLFSDEDEKRLKELEAKSNGS